MPSTLLANQHIFHESLVFLIRHCIQFITLIIFCYREPARAPSRSPSESEDEMDTQERERVQDLKERDELSKRLREKDKTKTRQVMSKTEKKVS